MANRISVSYINQTKPNQTNRFNQIWFRQLFVSKTQSLKPFHLFATLLLPTMSLLLRTLPLPLRPSPFLSATATANAASLFLLPKLRNPLPRTRRTFSNSTAAATSIDSVVKPPPPPLPPSVLRWVSRTELCGELSVEDVGKRVHLCGWVALHRVHGGLTFLNLRDHTGIVQVFYLN